MEHLQRNGYRVIALRDLRQWVDPANKPADPWAIINQRSHNLREASRRQNR
jgi:hypothetical protein